MVSERFHQAANDISCRWLIRQACGVDTLSLACVLCVHVVKTNQPKIVPFGEITQQSQSVERNETLGHWEMKSRDVRSE